ncbi:N-acetyltransferase [Luteolibacter pohnpeiensis]|uniref:N-acetyltransferase n=1 Tax=Luteolibacter pohnpeiensis TaxID=454153 RepID=A0A934VXA8_9BACT|nr:GNAT family N-acetyltransferase [Luteolibacter pohnpeiensis]MBK1883339.1 N-acetyltransferase [Luteolibacter pohnpeiensis]
MEKQALIDNTERHRFEMIEDGKMVFGDYRIEDGIMTLPYVEADPLLRGTGAAGRFMAAVLDLAKERGLKVVPICSYAMTYFQRHPEYHDLLA